MNEIYPGFHVNSSSSFTRRRFKEFGKLEGEAEKWIGFEGNRICTLDPRTDLRTFPYRGAPHSRMADGTLADRNFNKYFYY